MGLGLDRKLKEQILRASLAITGDAHYSVNIVEVVSVTTSRIDRWVWLPNDYFPADNLGNIEIWLQNHGLWNETSSVHDQQSVDGLDRRSARTEHDETMFHRIDTRPLQCLRLVDDPVHMCMTMMCRFPSLLPRASWCWRYAVRRACEVQCTSFVLCSSGIEARSKDYHWDR